MVSEQLLYYSDNCFGTPDTMSFENGKLRIHDLKNGIIKASIRQLETYAGIFCLEYRINPFDIEIELRIYQNGDVQIYDADPDVIEHIMERIVESDRQVEFIREKARRAGN